MQGFVDDLEAVTHANAMFRRVLYTAAHLQLVLMSLKPGEEIGDEVHETHDQFFRVEAGDGVVSIDGKTSPLKDGYAVIVPAGVRHNITNTSSVPLRLYTLYAPPQHRDGFAVETRAEAEGSLETFDGKVSA